MQSDLWSSPLLGEAVSEKDAEEMRASPSRPGHRRAATAPLRYPTTAATRSLPSMAPASGSPDLPRRCPSSCSSSSPAISWPIAMRPSDERGRSEPRNVGGPWAFGSKGVGLRDPGSRAFLARDARYGAKIWGSSRPQPSPASNDLLVGAIGEGWLWRSLSPPACAVSWAARTSAAIAPDQALSATGPGNRRARGVDPQAGD
jgi:hypothetical protein